jgi:peptidoglycan/xylan/chitin deacetylase (PgdA/CDA1 family)
MSLWNGKQGAISLTFDDALECQLNYAIPALNSAGLPGTFFACSNSPDYPLRYLNMWRAAASMGHEIGSHGDKHLKAATLSPHMGEYEALHSKEVLEGLFNVPVTSFCYPYTDAPKQIQEPVSRHYLQARGGRVARANKFVRPGDGVNLYNVPCYHIAQCVMETGDAFRYVDEAIRQNAWVTFMFHAVGDAQGWDNVLRDMFADFCQHLHRRRNEIWTATFAQAAQNLRENQ